MYQLCHELESVARESITSATDGQEVERDISIFNDSNGSQDGYLDSDMTCSLLISKETRENVMSVTCFRIGDQIEQRYQSCRLDHKGKKK